MSIIGGGENNPGGKLTPFNTLPKERVKEITSMGGKASGEAKRKRKAMREQLQVLLSLPSKSRKAQKMMKDLGLKTEDMTTQMEMLLAMYQKALQGDVQAASFVRDTSGQKPVDRSEVTEIKPVMFEGESELQD